MRWVIEVLPLRLLEDCMAAYVASAVSQKMIHNLTIVGLTYGLSKSVLVRKPRSSLAFVLFS